MLKGSIVVICSFIVLQVELRSTVLRDNQPTRRMNEITEDLFLFFPDCRNDGLNLRWGHAVNSWSELNGTLASENATRIHMIEGDVIIRQNSTEDIPIMGHPPATDGNLTFEDWLKTINKFKGENSTDKNATLRVGAKADFKSLPAVRAALKIVKEYRNLLSVPLWLNADIVNGPDGGGPAKPVNAEEFLQLCTDEGPGLTLSLGWTTPPTVDDIRCGQGYTWREILSIYREILPFIRRTAAADRLPRITFAVRAALVRPSIDRLLWLLDACAAAAGGQQYKEKFSITLWTVAKADQLAMEDFKALNGLRSLAGKNRIFIDLPDRDIDCLNEPGISNQGVNTTSTAVDSSDGTSMAINDWTFPADPNVIVGEKIGVTYLGETQNRLTSVQLSSKAILRGRFVLLPPNDHSSSSDSISVSIVDREITQWKFEFAGTCVQDEQKNKEKKNYKCIPLEKRNEYYGFSLAVNGSDMKLEWNVDPSGFPYSSSRPKSPSSGCNLPLNCTTDPHPPAGNLDSGTFQTSLESELGPFKFVIEKAGAGDLLLDKLSVHRE